MYVIFDMDGVIVDSEAVYLAGYLHAAQLYDLPIEDMRTAVDRATSVTPMTERAIMTETFGHLPQFSMDKTYKACRDYFNNQYCGDRADEAQARCGGDPEVSGRQ